MEREQIRENLANISQAIDSITDTNLRRYIDAQIVIIHRKFLGKETESVEKEASVYRLKMQE